MKKLTSLLLVEERLFEAEYFALLLKDKHTLELQFHLNAFLSAARSVTFLIQKELRHVDNFTEFWAQIQNTLRQDKAAKFFMELRNYSQKEGRVSVIGWGGSMKLTDYKFPEVLGEEPKMLYFFSEGTIAVPKEISSADIVVACLRHTAKLAKITLQTMDQFPFATCPSQACTIEGAKFLGRDLGDFLEISGFPRSWAAASNNLPIEEAYKVVSKNFDAIDRKAIAAITDYSLL